MEKLGTRRSLVYENSEGVHSERQREANEAIEKVLSECKKILADVVNRHGSMFLGGKFLLCYGKACKDE